jgi:PAS domain S-box-containing protein
VILAANRADEISPFLSEVMQPIMEFFNFQSGAVYLREPDKSMGRLVGIYGKVSEMYAIPPLVDMSDRAIDEEAKRNRLFPFEFVVEKNRLPASLSSAVCLPLFSKEQTIGLVIFASTSQKEQSIKEAELLFAIGRQIGTAIAKIHSEAALRESENRYRTITQQVLIGIQIFRSGELIFINEGWSKITGYPQDETTGWKIKDYMSIVHPDDRDLLSSQISKIETEKAVNEKINPVLDFRFLSRGGDVKWVLAHLKKIQFTEGDAVAGIIVDITDRKIAEQSLASANQRLKAREEQLKNTNSELFAAIEQLKANQRELFAMNREKEVLIKEIHHRVKNNLQVISSLLKLQASHLADQKAIMALKECQQRIKSIAIVHEKLYQFNNLAEIGIPVYVESLVNHLVMMFASDPTRITLNFDLANIPITIEQAIPCSMIINELVSNALKYAFPDKRKGTITVAFKELNASTVKLSVADDGAGLPKNIDLKNTASLGMQLVTTFVEQLGGEIAVQSEPDKGTAFNIQFKLQKKILTPSDFKTVPAENIIKI